VAALETHDRSRAICEQINYFAFAFIAPLTAEHDNIFCHH
jgi:hypothetical protein